MIINQNDAFASETNSDVSIKKQTPQWYARNLLNGLYRAIAGDSKDRFDYEERLNLIKLSQGEPDLEAIKKIFNPFNVDGIELKVPIKHFPVVYPRISLLIGEAVKRPLKFNIFSYSKYEYQIRLAEKEKMLDDVIKNSMMQENLKQEDIEAQLENIKKSRIITKPSIFASKLISAYMKKYNIDKLMMDTMAIAFITGDPCCYIDDDGSYRLLDTDKVFVNFSETNDNLFENALEIAEINYLTIEEIIDIYGHLIDNHSFFIENHTSKINNPNRFSLNYGNDIIFTDPKSELDKESYLAYSKTNYASGYYNNAIRVAKVTFKGFKKIKEISYFKDGKPAKRIASEFYKSNKSLGETEKTRMITQYYTGLIIGDDDFYDMKPIVNKTISAQGKVFNTSGYVGYLQAFKNRKVITLFSISKSLSELYDLIVSRLYQIIPINIGPIADMELAKKPRNMSVNEWITYFFRHNIKLKDSFNVGMEGPAKGLLATNINNTEHQTPSFDFSNIIISYINLLNWVTNQIEIITGVSQSRLGAIHNEQLVGTMTQSINQSVLSTEMIFFRHYQFISSLLNNVYYNLINHLKDYPEDIYGLGIDDVKDALQFVQELDTLSEVRVTNTAREIDLCLRIDALVNAQFSNNQISAHIASKVLYAISSDEKLMILEEEQLRQSKIAEEEKKFQIDFENQKYNRELEKLNIQLEADKKISENNNRTDLDKLLKEIEFKREELKALIDKDKELTELKLKNSKEIAENKANFDK